MSIVFKYAFVPLPIIGSIYPFARKYGGVSQDIPHPLYQAYKKGLMEIFQKYPNVVYAAGHEHNLQFQKEGNLNHIVSGSGCKTQHVKPGSGGDALFSDKEKGFARVNYYDNGRSGRNSTYQMVRVKPAVLYSARPCTPSRPWPPPTRWRGLPAPRGPTLLIAP
ncbi:hypothetical protein MUN84_09400 [Hymenobacter sp. 5516J-16]|uniref:hypothetical protein n=1 Tax=Hymenobacter sp. 5516J-16 TaxID=2932253 RepID=UPI001FD27A21|nr:hypothetical protein [Hymenobacter sp. 5516J-16]UOQ78721.1 hypothetical protein MUN84_09400 [Hymenobacter sp. 5516J-16]